MYGQFSENIWNIACIGDLCPVERFWLIPLLQPQHVTVSVDIQRLGKLLYAVLCCNLGAEGTEATGPEVVLKTT